MRGLALIAVLLLAAPDAILAAPAISGSDLPGRERFRFTDPPGAGLMQPTQPNVQFPWDGRSAGQGACSVHVARSSKWKRVKRRGC